MSNRRGQLARCAAVALLGVTLVAAVESTAQASEPASVASAIIDDEPLLMRHPPSSVRVPLVIGGLGATGVAYGVSALAATTWSDVPGADALLVPVVGPWISLAQNGCAPLIALVSMMSLSCVLVPWALM